MAVRIPIHLSWSRLLTGGGLVARPGPTTNRPQVDSLPHRGSVEN